MQYFDKQINQVEEFMTKSNFKFKLFTFTFLNKQKYNGQNINN